LRTTWVDLSSDFGTTSIGLVFEAPWTDNGSARITSACSIDARWAKSTQEGTTATPSDIDKSQTADNRGAPFLPPTDSPDWFPIRLDRTWLDLVDAIVPPESSNYPNRTMRVLESLLTDGNIIDAEMSDSQDPGTVWDDTGKTLMLELATTLLITDGLSRHGITLVLNMNSTNSEKWTLLQNQKTPDFDYHFLRGDGQAIEVPSGTNATAQSLTLVINGYSYLASEITDYLSAGVLLAYIALALGYTVYTVFFRTQTSHAWDSVTEIITLAHNSRPSHTALRNTSSGIARFRTFAQIARIGARRTGGSSDDGQGHEHYQAELIFVEDGTSPDDETQETLDDSSHVVGRMVHPVSLPLAPKTPWRVGGNSSTTLEPADEGSTSQASLLRPGHNRGLSEDTFDSLRYRGLGVERFEVIQPDHLYG
jgi:hypothetical protein